jgi:hypothetical protein
MDTTNEITYIRVESILLLKRKINLANINPQAAEKVQSELMSGETIYWAGMPNPSVVFHSDDWAAIPFAVFFVGFSIFWESGVLGFWGNNSRSNGPSLFMALWGIPFILVGQYLLWGRFLVDAWLKRRTYYALTNRRLLILQEGWKRKESSVCLESVPSIGREGTRIGTLWFGPKYPVVAGRGQKTRSWSRFSVGDVPVLADIDDVESVYRQALDLKEAAGKRSIGTNN